jgi:hypothetical protein
MSEEFAASFWSVIQVCLRRRAVGEPAITADREVPHNQLAQFYKGGCRHRFE